MRHLKSGLLAFLPLLLVFSLPLNAQTASAGQSGGDISTNDSGKSIKPPMTESPTQGEVLTNDSIITMTRASLSTDIIVSKILSSKSSFNVSTDELIRLKQAKVADEVVKAMVLASSSEMGRMSQVGAGDVSRTDPNDPMATHEAGIYLYEEKDGKRQMTQLEPSVSKQTKSGGFLASAVTYGIAKIKFKAALAGRNAKLQLAHPRPVFYFYFVVKNSGLSCSSYYSTSPIEFVLV